MNKMIWQFTGNEAPYESVIAAAGNGWETLVANLIDDLFELGWDGTVAQVKEKFGGLRFYIGAGNDAIWARIEKAEKESYSLCIRCGGPGEIYTDGWYLTLCDKHAKELKRERNGSRFRDEPLP